MTAKEAVNWIISLTVDIGREIYQDLWHYGPALNEIKELLENEPEPNWIPVEERLPKAYEDCLWTTTDGRVVLYYCDGMFSKYTAWMPLPKPYREKNCQQEGMTFKLNHPLTEEQWDAITDVDMEHTPMIEFHTKNGKIVKYRKVEEE